MRKFLVNSEYLLRLPNMGISENGGWMLFEWHIVQLLLYVVFSYYEVTHVYLITPIKKTFSGKLIVEYAELLFLPSEDRVETKFGVSVL